MNKAILLLGLLFSLHSLGAQSDRIELSLLFPVDVSNQLRSLSPGKHKFVFSSDLKLIISTSTEKKPNHKDLGGALEVSTAGYIEVQSAEPLKLSFDNRSGGYCPAYASLSQIFSALSTALPVGSSVELVNNPNAAECSQ